MTDGWREVLCLQPILFLLQILDLYQFFSHLLCSICDVDSYSFLAEISRLFNFDVKESVTKLLSLQIEARFIASLIRLLLLLDAFVAKLDSWHTLERLVLYDLEKGDVIVVRWEALVDLCWIYKVRLEYIRV